MIIKSSLEQQTNEFPEILGSNFFVELLNGQRAKYLNLDNAATTPSFKLIYDKIGVFLNSYGSIHRGSGIKSQISTEIFDESVSIILRFLGVSKNEYSLIFTHNTTSGINMLARMLGLSQRDVVFISEFEHSANDLPWRKGAKIIRIPADKSGQLDIMYFESALKNNSTKGRRFVAVSGASNITGALTPIHEIAKMAHAHGAHIMVDAAQLAAHRAISLKGDTETEDLDFISFSGHKMYAPYGGGVLIGKKDLIDKMIPNDIGGGSVDFVTPEAYDLAQDHMKRSTSGTPNVLGAISIALSCELLKHQICFDSIIRHEQAILDRARFVFPKVEEVVTYCDLDFDAVKKCSILTFSIKGLHPNLVSARLGHEFGIGVRHGPICQFSYVAMLLGLSSKEIQAARAAVLAGQPDGMFGIVRASFGLENNIDDVDCLAKALSEIAETPKVNDDYYLNKHGEFWPKKKLEINISDFFKTRS